MTSATVLREEPTTDAVPHHSIPGWTERFGVIAGITGRGGEGETAGFDLGLHSDEPVGRIMAHWQTFQESLPRFRGFVLGDQVHGTEVRWHGPLRGWLRQAGVDGNGTVSPGILLLATVADCIPVYLVAPEARACALLHAGWRGASAGIVERGLELLGEQSGANATEVVMHCGVGVCGTCYEVGYEVLEAFGLRGDLPAPWAIDLRERLTTEALSLGVREATVSDWCSVHNNDRFFSHRASRGGPGRMVAYLGFPAPA
ncbi:MAG: laccase domain-containing protein [Gemmatimonadales bacterium]